jgi:hypothetical protein
MQRAAPSGVKPDGLAPWPPAERPVRRGATVRPPARPTPDAGVPAASWTDGDGAPGMQGMKSAEIEGLRTLTRVLDRYMVDPLLGLILPGAGDLIGSMLGLYVVGIALRRRMSPVIVARMLLNLALDAGLGLIPFLGDIADFAFKANDRNLALLLERGDARTATARDWLVVVGAALVFLTVIGLVIYAIVAFVRAIA